MIWYKLQLIYFLIILHFQEYNEDRPFIYEVPQDESAIEGDNITLVCKINTPTIGCVWKKGNNVMNFNTSKGSKYTIGVSGEPGDCSLLISGVQLEIDHGLWSCQPLVSSQILDSKTAHLSVFAKPWDPILEYKGETLNNYQIISLPPSDNFYTIALSCTSHMANPDVNHEWSLNGNKISSSSQGIYPDVRRFTTVTVSSLDIIMHPESDPITVSCVAKHITYGDNKTKQTFVDFTPQQYPVSYVFLYSACPNYQMNDDGAFYLPYNGHLGFICVAKAYPKPTFKWETDRNGTWNLITKNALGNILTIDEPGIYRCSAVNEISPKKLYSHAVKIVTSKSDFQPRRFFSESIVNDILVEPLDIHGLPGYFFVLDCLFSEPVEECVWYKDGERIDLNSRQIEFLSHHPTRGDCSIRFNNPQLQDAGYWLCEGTMSFLGETLHSKLAKVTLTGPPEVAQITVEGRDLYLGQKAYVQVPYGDKKIVPVTCSFISNYDKFNIDWKVNGQLQQPVHTTIVSTSNALFNISSVLVIEVVSPDTVVKRQEIHLKCIGKKFEYYFDTEPIGTEAILSIEYATNSVRIYPCCNVEILMGNSTHLFCEANGFTAPVIRWQQLINQTWNWIKVDKVHIPWIKISTAGYYRCLAGNYLNPTLIESDIVCIDIYIPSMSSTEARLNLIWYIFLYFCLLLNSYN